MQQVQIVPRTGGDQLRLVPAPVTQLPQLMSRLPVVNSVHHTVVPSLNTSLSTGTMGSIGTMGTMGAVERQGAARDGIGVVHPKKKQRLLTFLTEQQNVPQECKNEQTLIINPIVSQVVPRFQTLHCTLLK